MKCKYCNQEKLDSEFTINNRSRCKQCRKEYIKARRIALGETKYKRGEPFGDLSGQKHGLLTIVKFIEIKNSISWWLCRCDCGNEKKLPRNHLGAKIKVQSCGCLRNRKREMNPNFKGIGQISGVRWSRIKFMARKRAIEFNLSIEDAWNLFEKQNRRCALSNAPIEFSSKKSKSATASLDRIDSTKGYIKDNVQWVHKDINQMKMALSQSRFIELCKLVSNNFPIFKCLRDYE